MKIGILGTGDVGKTLGHKLAELGHEVCIGSRTEQNPAVLEWMATLPESLRLTTDDFSHACGFGDVIINCLGGQHSVPVLQQIAVSDLVGKILIDVSNPLDFSNGFPPTLTISNTTSLGEQIQQLLPNTQVVKALNTVHHQLMVNPQLLSESTDLFICGNDPEAKKQVRDIITSFGWESIIDLGDISNSRATEMYLIFWTRLFRVIGDGQFNIKIIQ